MASGKRIGFDLEVSCDGLEFTISRRGDHLTGFDEALAWFSSETHATLRCLRGRPFVLAARLYLACRSCGYDNGETSEIPTSCACDAEPWGMTDPT